MKYNGRGFLYGVPARDLTDDEAKKYGVEKLLKSGLYEQDEPVLQTFEKRTTRSEVREKARKSKEQ